MKPYITDEIIDASSFVNSRTGIRGHVSSPSASKQTVLVGKSKTEVRNLMTAIGLQEWAKQTQPENIANAMDMLAETNPAATDSSGLSPLELVRLAVDLARKPAKPAKRRAAVGRDSFSDSSTADLNSLYAKLHRSNKR